MFWKIGLVLGILGLVVGIIILIISIAALRSTTDENTADIAVGGLLVGVVLIIGSILLAIVSTIFVLRASKKEYDAKNPPKKD